MNRRVFLKRSTQAATAMALPHVPQIDLRRETQLKAFLLEPYGLRCSALTADDALSFFESNCFETFSPKDVAEIRQGTPCPPHYFGLDDPPYEASRSFWDELEHRSKCGEVDPDFFYDMMAVAPGAARRNMPWTRLKRGEQTPSEGRLVWTSEGKTVRRGTWHTGHPITLTDAGWPAGEWRDSHGDRIASVTHWLELDGGTVPAPPV